MVKARFFILMMVAAVSASLVFAQTKEAKQDKEAVKEQKAEKGAEKARTRSEANAQYQGLFASAAGQGGYLGVYLEEVTPEQYRQLKLKEERGAVVMRVMEGGPAEKAGLKENDVIISFNGRRVDTVRELQRMLSETPAGRSVNLEVLRGGSTQSINATLQERSAATVYRRQVDQAARAQQRQADQLARAKERQEQAQKRQLEAQQRATERYRGAFDSVSPGRFSVIRGGRLGVTIESITPQLGEYFGVKDGKGALITEVRENSVGAKGGLKAGDVVIDADGKKVDDPSVLIQSLAAKQEGPINLKVMRNRKEQTVTVTLEKAPAPARTRTTGRGNSV